MSALYIPLSIQYL